MKRIALLLVVMLAFPFAGQAQPQISDKDLVNVIWAMGQMYPEGFTLDINTLQQPTKGIAVSYLATQNSFDKKDIPAVIKHAKAHNGYIGGWYNSENGKYYFDSTRLFPEDSLTAALAFARENEQNSVYDLSKGIEIWVKARTI